jgi:phospholipid/cholesterol/gamma-HCH transport system substrate-binding protein
VRDPGLRQDHSSDFKVGILVLISLIVLVVGVFWISNTRFGGPALRLYAVAPQAQQMTADARIFFLGVDVGEVTSVQLRGRRVEMEFAIFEELDLPADSRGIIQAAGFLGSQMITLVPGTAAESLADGDTIQLGSQRDVMAMAGDLGDEANVVLERIQDVLSEQMVSDVQESSAAFSAAMRELEALIRAERNSVHDLVGSLAETSGHLAELSGGPELERSLASIDSLTSRLNSAAAGLDSTSHSLASITARLDSGEGTLGKLLTDERLYEDLTAAIENVHVASEEIALLMRDLREQPDRYLRGLRISVF